MQAVVVEPVTDLRCCGKHRRQAVVAVATPRGVAIAIVIGQSAFVHLRVAVVVQPVAQLGRAGIDD